MQEDVENKTVSLAVQTLKLSFRVIFEAWRLYRMNHNGPVSDRPEAVVGEQSVKDLIGQGEGVASVDIEAAGLEDFRKVANEFGVDFAVVKDSNQEPPVYTVFFKAKDGAAIDKAMAAYAARDLNFEASRTAEQAAEKATERTAEAAAKTAETTAEKAARASPYERPSMLKKLAKLREMVSKIPHKAKEKNKELNR